MITKREIWNHHTRKSIWEKGLITECGFGDCYSVDKMGHLLKLADEYDIQGVLDLCIKCLQDVPKSEGNVVKIFYLATDTLIAIEDCRLDGVRDECEILLEDMDLATIAAKSDFKKLNRDSMERVFVKRTERLETLIREVYPQLVGLVEYCLYLKLASSSVITCCPQHFLGNKSYTDLLERIRSCFVCKQMITHLVTTSVTPEQQPQTLARQRAVFDGFQAAGPQPIIAVVCVVH